MCRESIWDICLPICPGLKTLEKGQASPGTGVLGLLATVFPFLDPRPPWRDSISRELGLRGGPASKHSSASLLPKRNTEPRHRGPVQALHLGPQATVLSSDLSHYFLVFKMRELDDL